MPGWPACTRLSRCVPKSCGRYLRFSTRQLRFERTFERVGVEIRPQENGYEILYLSSRAIGMAPMCVTLLVAQTLKVHVSWQR